MKLEKQLSQGIWRTRNSSGEPGFGKNLENKKNNQRITIGELRRISGD